MRLQFVGTLLLTALISNAVPHAGNRRAPSVLAETLKISDLQDSDGQSIFPSNADKTLQKVEDYNFAADPAEFIVYQIKDGWEVNDGVVAAYAMTKTDGEEMPETVKDLQAGRLLLSYGYDEAHQRWWAVRREFKSSKSGLEPDRVAYKGNGW